MACQERTFSVTKSVWSKGSTSSGNFVPFFTVDATAFREARVAFRLSPDTALGDSTCAVTVRPEYALSKDGGVTWPSTIGFGPSATDAKGWHYATDYEALNAEARSVIFGVRVLNVSGTAIRGALVKLRVDLRSED